MDKCIVCQTILGPKRLRLRGMKCLKFEIYQKLLNFLHPYDLKALYDTDIFPDPKICNMCFVTIKQIPQGVHKIQKLLSGPINTRIHQQDRIGWTLSTDDIKLSKCTHSEIISQDANNLNSQTSLPVNCPVDSSFHFERNLPSSQSKEKRMLHYNKRKAIKKNEEPEKDLQLACEEDGCTEVFTSHKDFFDHFLDHYCTQPCSCDFNYCGEMFSSLLLKSKHSKLHYDGRYACPWSSCEKQVASSFFCMKTHLYKHIMADLPSVADNRPHSCSHCHMMFRQESNLLHHSRQHREKTKFVCPTCGKKFRRCHLQRHLLTHSQEKPHSCSHCDKRYATINGLKFHILQDHSIGKWPYQCTLCQKGFVTKTELNRHMTSHTGEQPFTCSLCNASFGTRAGYKSHMRKHTGEKFACNVPGCSKIYSSPQTLRYHAATHQGFTNTCPQCGHTYHTPYGHKCKASREAKKNQQQVNKGTEFLNKQNKKSVVPDSTQLLLQRRVNHVPGENSSSTPDTLPHLSVLVPDATLDTDGNLSLSNTLDLIPTTVELNVPHCIPEIL